MLLVNIIELHLPGAKNLLFLLPRTLHTAYVVKPGCFSSYFLFEIVDFPEEMKNLCFTEYSVFVDDDVDPKIFSKTPFESSFEGGAQFTNRKSLFTAKVVVTMKGSPIEAIRKRDEEDINQICERLKAETIKTRKRTDFDMETEEGEQQQAKKFKLEDQFLLN